MKKVLLIATGGTIACVETEAGMMPALDGAALVEQVPQLKDICGIDVLQLMQLDSTNIQPEHWIEMAHAVADNYDKYDGFVITHGTDTMAYSAAALYYMLENLQKPVIFTGSQLSLTEEGSDAPDNLITAFWAARGNFAGVYLAFFGRLIQGNAAKKLYTENFYAFHSINVPEVAKLYDGKLLMNDTYISYAKENLLDKAVELRKNNYPLKVHDKLCTKVMVLEIYPGFEGDMIKAVVDMGYKGIVLKAYGAGDIPTDESPRSLLSALEYARDKGVIVVGSTQSIYDGVHMERYEVGLSAMKRGVRSGGELTTEAWLVKIMLELA